MDFKNKIVLVTGSTSGIGKATAEKLHKAGATVILNSYEDTSLSLSRIFSKR